jgi:hypothetical protein
MGRRHQNVHTLLLAPGFWLLAPLIFAVLTKDVPANSFVAGVPAKVIRSLEDGLDTIQTQPQINAD